MVLWLATNVLLFFLTLSGSGGVAVGPLERGDRGGSNGAKIRAGFAVLRLWGLFEKNCKKKHTQKKKRELKKKSHPCFFKKKLSPTKIRSNSVFKKCIFCDFLHVFANFCMFYTIFFTFFACFMRFFVCFYINFKQVCQVHGSRGSHRAAWFCDIFY
jgi:hypothetical protein